MISTRDLAHELDKSKTTVVKYASQLGVGKFQGQRLMFTTAEVAKIKRALAGPKSKGGRPRKK